MTDSASRESSNDPTKGDTPTGDPLRVGRGLVEDETESGDTTGRTVTDDGAIASEFVQRESRDGGREIDKEHSTHTSLASGGLGAHVMDADGIDTADE